MTQIRSPRVEDRAEWVRMRRALWPTCPDEEHDAEIGLFLQSSHDTSPASCRYGVGEIAVWIAERPSGGLCGFLEASIRPYAEGSEAQPVGYIEGWYVDPDVRRHRGRSGRSSWLLRSGFDRWVAVRWRPTPRSRTA